MFGSEVSRNRSPSSIMNGNNASVSVNENQFFVKPSCGNNEEEKHNDLEKNFTLKFDDELKLRTPFINEISAFVFNFEGILKGLRY